MIKVAIIEDNITTLSYLEALLAGSGKIDVVGVYSTGREVLNKIDHNLPDLLLADLNLPDISGNDVIKAIKRRFDRMEILVLTMYEDKQHLFVALKAGATGYLLKGASSTDIIAAIEDIMMGGAPMSPKIARSIIDEFKSGTDNRATPLLTPREKEVLNAVGAGLSEKSVAANLSLSPHTVHTHIKHIYKKLHVRSKTEALSKAKSKGII